MRRNADLNSHINETVISGHPADFPVSLQPVFHDRQDGRRLIPARRAIVREDTGQAIAVVSDRYTLVPHTRILEVIDDAIRPLDVGPVPRGIYVDRQGARMRALYKFPALARPVRGTDDICPCLQIRNTYDATSRIAVHIGAFRFVCTNLAVGGGGVYAGGFMSVHAGEIAIEKVAEQLAGYLTGFEQIIELYRLWSDQRLNMSSLRRLFEETLRGKPQRLWPELEKAVGRSVYDGYNVATDFATHQMGSHRAAFNLLERLNSGFQEVFPVTNENITVNHVLQPAEKADKRDARVSLEEPR